MKLSADQRLTQLHNAVELLRDGVNKVTKDGDSKYLILIGGQLRALIGKGGRNFHPLLLDLAQELNHPLICFGPPNTNMNDPFYQGLVFRIPGRFIGIGPYSPAQKRYYLSDWLDVNVIVLDREVYSANEILRGFSDREASHYDDKVDMKIQKLKNLIYGNSIISINGIEKFLLDTANYVIQVVTDF